jgi:hypothetical protein
MADFKGVNFRVYELYLNKPIINKKQTSGKAAL